EALRRLGHRHLHDGAGIAQATHQFHGLVRGHAAGDAQQHAAPFQRPVRSGSRSLHRPELSLRHNRLPAYPNGSFPPMSPRPCRRFTVPSPLPVSPPMQIRDWPAAERPREKMVARGASVLSDAELLAIFLGSVLRGQDPVATARALLTAHGPLRALLERSPGELAALPGLGPARACQLAAALELCDRYLAAGLQRGEALTDPSAAGRYFAQRLRGHPCEVFAVLFLDTRH